MSMATSAAPLESGAGVAKLPFDPAALSASFAEGGAVQTFRAAIRSADQALGERFLRNEPIEDLVRERSRTVDEVILAGWRHFAAELLDRAALIAVGGYGRGELHPHSDIDLMVLLEEADRGRVDEPIGRFLAFLWDIGLEVGHSVRTLSDCENQARSDVTVLTTLMETRLLAGPLPLFEQLKARIAPQRMWSAADFFLAKLSEQAARH